jgi:hypothetical protein
MGGGAARATQRENGRSVHYGLDRIYDHLREHMIRLEQQQCLAGALLPLMWSTVLHHEGTEWRRGDKPR